MWISTIALTLDKFVERSEVNKQKKYCSLQKLNKYKHLYAIGYMR